MESDPVENQNQENNFYSIINNTIENDNIETALAMFGIMEDRYTEISSSIANSLVKNNWLKI